MTVYTLAALFAIASLSTFAFAYYKAFHSKEDKPSKIITGQSTRYRN